MKKDHLPVRITSALLGLTLLLAGCGDSEKTTPKPQLVHKKIAQQADRSRQDANVAMKPRPETPAPETKPFLAQGKLEAPQPPTSEPPVPPKPQSPPLAEALAEPTTSTTVQPVVSGVVSQASLPQEGGKKAPTSIVVSETQMAQRLQINTPEPYTAKGKVDPFEPLLRDETASNVVQLKSKKSTPSTPLEKIDIGQLKLVAIITAARGNLAMVQESSGKGYIIRPGTLIGTNSGKVIGIGADKVTFEEEYEDILGKTVIQKKEISLPKPSGEL
jgi:type IV pilus assembly protein PilP